MRTGFHDHLLPLLRRLVAPPSEEVVPTLDDIVEDAKREWILAKQYFETVSEPELVEHASYLIKATERRYMFLLRLSRSQRRAEVEAAKSGGDRKPDEVARSREA